MKKNNESKYKRRLKVKDIVVGVVAVYE